jgi:DNA end-binding protein Ku
MAARAFWKGYLKLSLVTCAVAMTPARSESDKVRFHTLNRKTGARVESVYVDAQTGARVAEADQAKAYQTGPEDYLLLDDDDLDAVALESTRTIDIETFVAADSIGWIYYDQPHFMVPDDKVGVEAFAVIREAMKATGTVGIARLVLYRRERAVMLQPRDAGIVVWTLRYGEEVRDAEDYFAAIAPARVESHALSMVDRLIEARTKPWSAGLTTDPVQQNLTRIIASKQKGARKPRGRTAEPARPANVIDIMDALRKSLAEDGKPHRARRR